MGQPRIRLRNGDQAQPADPAQPYGFILFFAINYMLIPTQISARIGSDESEFTSTSPVASSDAVMLVSQRPQLLPLAQLTSWDRSFDAQPSSTTAVYELDVVSPSPS